MPSCYPRYPVVTPSARHHHAFLLEDDVEISPHFYAWAKWATLSYQYGRPSDFMTNMYGVSLYTPRYSNVVLLHILVIWC